MKDLLIFSLTNPLRPFTEQLDELHRQNVKDNIYVASKYKINYIERECYLRPSMQKWIVKAGQNVVKTMNEIYIENLGKYKYFCRWDDDMLLPTFAINVALMTIQRERAIGAGLFFENVPQLVLMTNPKSEGWMGNFQRFYIYRCDVWAEIPVIVGSEIGDPDDPYQRSLKGKKIQLNFPSVHLDHRGFSGYPELDGKTEPDDWRALGNYKVILDLATFFYNAW